MKEGNQNHANWHLKPVLTYKILKMTFKRINKNPDEVTAWLSWWWVARVDVDLITRR